MTKRPEIARKRLQSLGECGLNETSGEGASNTNPALEHNADSGGRAMSRYGHYTLLRVILNTEHFANPCGVLA